MATENDFMNVSDAAALLGVHIQTLRRLARQKKIPAFKLGRDWRFRRQALVRWADSQLFESSGAPGTCLVLIIDDEEKVGVALSKMVERFGCRTRQALSGRIGLKLVAEEVPDLILLDLMMPGMTGPRFLQELRETHPTLPVAIVTGYPDSELLKDAMAHGPVLLVPKPVDSELLERTVRTVVGERLSSSITPVARHADGRTL